MALKIELEPGEQVLLIRGANGQTTTITLERKSGGKARLSIDAPKEDEIRRPGRAPAESPLTRPGLPAQERGEEAPPRRMSADPSTTQG